MNLLYDVYKKIAFSMDPEDAHLLSMHLLHQFPLIASFPYKKNLGDRYQVKLGSLNWDFPVGLAAGLDKNAEAIPFFSEIPFGAVEVGTVTPKAQEGNPKPRLFRYIEKGSIRNKMGFNNLGMEEIKKNFISGKRSKIVGVNIGKNKEVTEDNAHKDYQALYQNFADVADYIVINVSSPNTPGLRSLQSKENLNVIFESLKNIRAEMPCPLYIKISPDMNLEDVNDVIDVAKLQKLDGIIATNTTIMDELGDGGVSGELLFDRAKKTREYILDRLGETPEINFIGVGGFSNFDQIWDYWKKGGRALQIYTSFIYQGPNFLLDVKKNIDRILLTNNFKNLEELFANIKYL